MGGTSSFKTSLEDRLNLIKPTSKEIEQLLQEHPSPLSPNIATSVDKLHGRGTHVYLVSGGFRVMINPVAESLKIPIHRVFANTILFDESGNYCGFDDTEKTCRDGGKARVIQSLKDLHGYDTVIMIGDGVTDMEAKPPASAFIGFGGVVKREKVAEGADWFVEDFQTLIDALD